MQSSFTHHIIQQYLFEETTCQEQTASNSFKSLSPNADWYVTSPNNITVKSNIKVMRIWEMIMKDFMIPFHIRA